MSSPGALRVLSIAVIGKAGNPLFLQSYSTRQCDQADLKWHYAAHTSLDFFEERGELSTTATALDPFTPAFEWEKELTWATRVAELPAAKTTDSYLGLLYAMEDYAVCVLGQMGRVV